jgi:hypothetical protein
MKNNLIKIGIGLLFLGLIIFIIYKSLQPEKPFNKIDLPTDNVVNNTIFPKYYDTILVVAMDKMNIKNQTINVLRISNNAKIEGHDLKAHIRYYEGVFYLFINELNKFQCIDVISHEVIHIEQYVSEDLKYENGVVLWENNTYELNLTEYSVRPWEEDAFKRQGELIKQVKNVLY